MHTHMHTHTHSLSLSPPSFDVTWLTQVDAREMVHHGNLLCAQMLLDSDGVVGPALHSCVVGNNHALGAAGARESTNKQHNTQHTQHNTNSTHMTTHTKQTTHMTHNTHNAHNTEKRERKRTDSEDTGRYEKSREGGEGLRVCDFSQSHP